MTSAAPSYLPSATSTSPPLPNRTLYITSYDRNTPPSPKPALEYDVRLARNPVKHLRDLHTGLSQRVQDVLSTDARFEELFACAVGEIGETMLQIDGYERTRGGAKNGKRDSVQEGVAFAEKLGMHPWPEGWEVKVEHRDLSDEVRGEKARNREVQREMRGCS
ncbi:uncharacterized protein K452DRAFT_291858 [Aplosporella prunicola CBS 121167]|uniref:RapZ C-terminal domain-containing protein n=1 Tax=Aplosporella prunicola CBS 121167 TaxID=1176127 RepID=A0A6A6B227_9PEZI|nr:uncharacterized protein K452DRAFT_291858 [Aplosporella prunicola CBS 121167]KAF2137067.1 hypothetical protein K452DRAFT_291858 [Aplosporella prunicola CBS 121167]